MICGGKRRRLIGERWEGKRGRGGKEKERGVGVKPRKTAKTRIFFTKFSYLGAPVPTTIPIWAKFDV